MEPQDIAFGVCRAYINDNRDILSTSLCKSLLGSVRSRSVAKLAKASLLVEPTLYTADLLRVLLQIEAFFKKNEHYSDPVRCDAAALETFFKAEKQCRITNRRLYHYMEYPDRLPHQRGVQWASMELYIQNVLGSFDDFLGELPQRLQVTGGASATTPRRLSQPPKKLKRRLEAGTRQIPYLRALSRYFGYRFAEPKLVNWNRVSTVTKNYLTARTIGCEPDAAVPLQLAFDSWGKDRLRLKTKIDLSSQVRNGELARLASIDDTDATVDVQTASDTVAYALVQGLFPAPWYSFLRDVRSPTYRLYDPKQSYPSKNYRIGTYAKFSSMGNGTTFCMETLIFAAACKAVGSKLECVYGDDIVIEKHLVEELIALLGYCGFKVNTEKTHINGPFRESCGINCFKGMDITPFKIKSFDFRKSNLSHNVNGLAAIASMDGELWAFLSSLIRRFQLPSTPYSEHSGSGIHIPVSDCYSKHIITCPKRAQSPRYKAYVSVGIKGGEESSRTLFLWFLERGRLKGQEDANDTAPFFPRNDVQVYLSRGRKRCNNRFAYQGFVPFTACERRLRNTSVQYQRVISSEYTTDTHKYKRKWVRWIPPSLVIPIHLYRWSDYLSARMGPEVAS